MAFLAGASLGQRVFQFLRQRSHGEIGANQQSRIFVRLVTLRGSHVDFRREFIAQVVILRVANQSHDLIDRPRAAHRLLNLKVRANGIGAVEDFLHETLVDDSHLERVSRVPLAECAAGHDADSHGVEKIGADLREKRCHVGAFCGAGQDNVFLPAIAAERHYTGVRDSLDAGKCAQAVNQVQLVALALRRGNFQLAKVQIGFHDAGRVETGVHRKNVFQAAHEEYRAHQQDQ